MYQKQLISLLIIGLLTIGLSPSVHSTLIESNIPDLGQRSDMSLTAETEAEIGQNLMQQLRSSDQLSEDAVINEYLKYISLKLGKAAEHLDFKLHLFAVNSPELNAFTFFGGHIAVHTGLILALNNENELAAVLAHETAHIAQRHLARILTTNKRLMPLTYAELLAAIAIGALGAPEAGSHLATAALAGHMQQLINFTRDHEKEADRIGLQILSKAGYDPAALPAVLRILSLRTRFHERPPEYLLTHPVHESRIADCANRAERMSYHQTVDNLFFELVRARIENDLPGNTKQRVKRLEERLPSEKQANQPAIQYTYALALAKNKQYKEAIQALDRLTQALPDHWIVELTRAEIELASGSTQAAIDHLKTLYHQYPNNHAIVLNYAQTLVKAKQSLEAERILSQHRKTHPADPQVLQLLVQTYSQLKRPTALHQTQAEWYASRGEFKEAFVQLDIALESINPQSQLARDIRMRKQDLEAQFEHQKKLKL